MIENIAAATPAEIDTEIARLGNEHAALARKVELLRSEMERIADEAATLEAQYRERRWTRVYRVNNDNGHVHTTTACRNTYETTDFVWFPNLSGLSAAEIVEQAGEYTCLTCFGRVRADILKAREGRPCRIETDDQRTKREQREAREAERTVKAAAADAKKLVRPVRISAAASRITTRNAAWAALVDATIDVEDWSDPQWYAHLPAERRAANLRDHATDAETLRAALVESLPDMTPEEFEATLTKKVKAKKASHNRALKRAGFAARY